MMLTELRGSCNTYNPTFTPPEIAKKTDTIKQSPLPLLIPQLTLLVCEHCSATQAHRTSRWMRQNHERVKTIRESG